MNRFCFLLAGCLLMTVQSLIRDRFGRGTLVTIHMEPEKQQL